ncbi:MAG: hypothetical protein PHV07_02895 [Oscillospiraceae bacterium]|nr:hypothetical protein [Oscillospiraceae bacterium]
MKKSILVLIGLIGVVLAGFSLFSGDAVAAGAVIMATGPMVGFGKSLTPHEKQEVLQIVRENMSFEGSEDFYDGGNDDFVDFDGAFNASFVTEAKSVYRQFTMNITNSSADAKEILLTPGYLWTPEYGSAFMRLIEFEKAITKKIAAEALDTGVPEKDFLIFDSSKWLTTEKGKGMIQDGYFAGAGEDFIKNGLTLAASGSPYDISEFYAFLMYNPTNLLGMKIQSNGGDGAQVAYPIEVIAQSPFKRLASKIINPSTNLDQHTYQTDIVVFNTDGVVLGNQTQLKYKIAPRISAEVPRSVNITFICGAVLNTAGALEKKQTKAIRNFGSLVQKINIAKKA